jgi:hypothetical protein
MLDIRTLLLSIPEDCYGPSTSWRRAERLLFPLLKGAAIRDRTRAPDPELHEAGVLQRG